MGKRILWFAAGLAAGFTAPATADQIMTVCKPIVLKDCGNHLQTYFERGGSIPNRCKIS